MCMLPFILAAAALARFLPARLASQAVSEGSPLPQADQRARQDHLSPRANGVPVRVRSQINQSDLLLI